MSRGERGTGGQEQSSGCTLKAEATVQVSQAMPGGNGRGLPENRVERGAATVFLLLLRALRSLLLFASAASSVCRRLGWAWVHSCPDSAPFQCSALQPFWPHFRFPRQIGLLGSSVQPCSTGCRWRIPAVLMSVCWEGLGTGQSPPTFAVTQYSQQLVYWGQAWGVRFDPILLGGWDRRFCSCRIVVDWVMEWERPGRWDPVGSELRRFRAGDPTR